MTIATNNGVPIIQGGKIVTDCSCCGGWYCYCEDNCNTSPACAYCLSSCPPYRAPESFTATISAEDYVNRVMGRVSFSLIGGTGTGVGLISYFNGSAISGSHTMNRVSATVYEAPLSPAPDCSGTFLGGSSIAFNLSSCSFALRIRRMHETSLANYPADTPPKEVGDLDCSSQLPPVGFLGTVPNSNWIHRNDSPNSFFDFSLQQGVFSRTCSEINSQTPVTLSMTLPERWWLQGQFTGFGIISSTPAGSYSGPEPVVYEQSGSRDITVTVTPNY